MDWMKVGKRTPDKPEIIAMSDRLQVDQDAVFGKCFRVWSWFDDNTENGCASSVTLAYIDRVTGLRGFAEAMIFVGWLKEENGVLKLPHFDRHNGKTAKNRALSAIRMAKSRLRDSCDTSVTKSQPEKRREEKNNNTPIVPKSDTGTPPGFTRFWTTYPTHRRIAKAKCLKSWKSQNCEAIADKIVDSVFAFRETKQWKDQGGSFVPHATTFLNRQQWETSPEPEEADVWASTPEAVAFLDPVIP